LQIDINTIHDAQPIIEPINKAYHIGKKVVESIHRLLVGIYRNSRELLKAKQTLKRESNISAFAVNGKFLLLASKPTHSLWAVVRD
jgi:hypothetical protein